MNFTAAHCFLEKAKTHKSPDIDSYKIALGAHNVSDPGEQNRIFIGIETILFHEDWTNPNNLLNFAGDIVVVNLKKDSNEMRIFTSEILKPICLPFGDDDEETFRKISSETVGSVAGWGLYENSHKSSDVPRAIRVPIIGKSDCVNKFPALSQAIWEKSFCSGSEAAKVCKGDSGSGFYVQVDAKYYLRGIVSSGIESPGGICDFDNHLSLFSDVIQYLDFIKKVCIFNRLRTICLTTQFYFSSD